MSDVPAAAREEFESLAARVRVIETYLFDGGGPGSPGQNALETRFRDLRAALRQLEGKVATKDDLDRIWERIAMLQNDLSSLRGGFRGGGDGIVTTT